MNLSIEILIAAIIATFPSIFVKKYIKTTENKFILFAITCYLFLIYMYTRIYKKEDLSRAYVSILTLQILIITFIATLYYKETLTKNKIIGILLAVTSIYFLSNKS